jgi:hypothetical protein
LKFSQGEYSIKSSTADNLVNVEKFFDVSGTDFVPIFRVLLMTE